MAGRGGALTQFGKGKIDGHHYREKVASSGGVRADDYVYWTCGFIQAAGGRHHSRQFLADTYFHHLLQGQDDWIYSQEFPPVGFLVHETSVQSFGSAALGLLVLELVSQTSDSSHVIMLNWSPSDSSHVIMLELVSF